MNELLGGIRVLDLSRVVAAPWCTQLLGDLGAEIIKVERAGRGDELRHYGPPFFLDEDGCDTAESSYFVSVNRNKKSITADFHTEEGAALIRELVAHCDVFIENFKVGDLARHGLDYPTIAAINPRIVYCSVTGFGQTGPYARRPATDPIAQAMCGMMSVTGESDRPPQRVGVAVTDIIAGLYAANAVQAALRHVERGGEGQHIDLSLLDVSIAIMSHRATDYMVSGQVPHRSGTRSPNSAPGEAFACADADIIIQAGAERQFASLCHVLGLTHLLEDPRFSTRANRVRNLKALLPPLKEKIAQWRAADLYEALAERSVICSPIYDMAEALADPQVVHRGMRREVVHPTVGPVPLLSNPIVYSGTPLTRYEPSPTLGQHTDEVLGDLLGYDAERRADLRRRGVI